MTPRERRVLTALAAAAVPVRVRDATATCIQLTRAGLVESVKVERTDGPALFKYQITAAGRAALENQ